MSPKPNPIGVMSKISLNLYSVKLSNSYNGTSAKHKVHVLISWYLLHYKGLASVLCDTQNFH